MTDQHNGNGSFDNRLKAFSNMNNDTPEERLDKGLSVIRFGFAECQKAIQQYLHEKAKLANK